MDITNYVEKRRALDDKKKTLEDKEKVLKEAEAKVKEVKSQIKLERRQRFKEKFDKVNVFKKLKPWIIWNSVLTLLVIFMFITAYVNNPSPEVSENNKVGGFLSNFFGFLSKKDDSTSTNIVTNNVSIQSNVSSSNTSNVAVNNTTIPIVNVTNTTQTNNTVAPVFINFDLHTDYNGDEFSTLNVNNGEDIVYSVVLENKNSYFITCDGYDYQSNVQGSHSVVRIEPGDERFLFTKVNKGSTNQVTVRHMFTCYKDGMDLEDGTTKQITVKVIFN